MTAKFNERGRGSRMLCSLISSECNESPNINVFNTVTIIDMMRQSSIGFVQFIIISIFVVYFILETVMLFVCRFKWTWIKVLLRAGSDRLALLVSRIIRCIGVSLTWRVFYNIILNTGLSFLVLYKLSGAIYYFLLFDNLER